MEGTPVHQHIVSAESGTDSHAHVDIRSGYWVCVHGVGVWVCKLTMGFITVYPPFLWVWISDFIKKVASTPVGVFLAPNAHIDLL